MQPDINSVEIHLQLSDDGHPVDGALLGDSSLWPPHPTDKSATPFSVLLTGRGQSALSLSAHRQTGLAISTGYSGPDINLPVCPAGICESVVFWEFLFVSRRGDHHRKTQK